MIKPRKSKSIYAVFYMEGISVFFYSETENRTSKMNLPWGLSYSNFHQDIIWKREAYAY